MFASPNAISAIGAFHVGGLFVAASDAPDAQKAAANYVCDGTADQVEIQAALDALSSGGRLVLSEGTFYCTAILTLYSNQVIVGQGKYRTTLKWANGAGAMAGSGGAATDGHGLLFIDSLTNVEIRDLGVDCNYANQSPTTCNSNGIYIHGPSSNVWVQFCFIQGANAGSNGDFGNGVRISALNQGNKCDRIHIDFNEFYNILASNAVQFSMFPEHCSANFNSVRSCTHGIDWSTGSFNECNNNIVQDLLASSSVALGMNYCNESTMNGNVTENCGIGISGHCYRNTIVGNILLGINTSTGQGINITNDGTGQNTITGNRISTFASAMKLDSNSHSNVISSNQIRNCPIGIDLVGDNDRCLITGNRIQDASTASIRLGASTTKNYVIGNHIGSSAAIADTGTGNDVTTNFTA